MIASLSSFWKRHRLILIAFIALCTAYANHFRNSFHFDDAHTIVDNPSIRSLHNIPRFFSDTSTFSVLPANRAWRPLIPLSLALDYQTGRGLNPVAFHASTFLWFLALVWLFYRLAQRVFEFARPGVDNTPAAAFASALYALHPVCAETVNYVVQRGELYATLGVAAGLYLYAARPQWRRYGLYLLPVAAGQLSKPPALVFPVILLAYVLLFEGRRFWPALRDTLPALGVTVAVGALHVLMTPATFQPGAAAPFFYRITQPYVALRYFTAFFLPLHLSVDTDLSAISDATDPLALSGYVFAAIAVAAAVACCRLRHTRPIGFGLLWFVITLVPTAIFPLAEVENDHRMFLPFLGLALAFVWTLVLARARVLRPVLAAGAAVILLAGFAWGTHLRNEVWRSEATLWRDVTVKSPRNGRGLMNYGLALMAAGDYTHAMQYFDRALQFTPNYYILEINLGILHGELRHDSEAERHFQRAMALAPRDYLPYHYYARWLDTRGRTTEALANAREAVRLNGSFLESRDLLRRIEARNAEPATAQQYLDLSFEHHRARRYTECIRMAREAIKLEPDLAEAYNNIAAAYEELGQWDEAIQAAARAVQLKPDFTLARNNLAWSMAQRAKLAEMKRHKE